MGVHLYDDQRRDRMFGDRQPVGQHHLRGGSDGDANHERDLATQTITFTTTLRPARLTAPTFTVAATGGASGNSGLPSAGSCSNLRDLHDDERRGNVFGDCESGGNANYSAAAQVTQTTNATQASQTITFTTSAPASAATA